MDQATVAFIVAFVGLTAGHCAAQAATITLDDEYEPNRRTLQPLAEDVWRIAQESFRVPAPLNLPIICHLEPSRVSALTSLDNWNEPKQIKILLTATNNHYAQFAYQLGHEIGHVMLNPRRTNGIIETIATAFSYEVLDRLAKDWQKVPPFEYVRSYAPEFRNYRVETEQNALEKFPSFVGSAVARNDWVTVRAFLAGHPDELDQLSEEAAAGTNGRAWQALAAMSLRAGTVDWSEVADLGQCTEPSPRVDSTMRYSPITRECAVRTSEMFCRIAQCR
jgi:hypothetical protein